MARTAPVPNIPAPPGMNPGAFVAGGGGNGGGAGGKGGKNGNGKEGAGTEDGDADASGDDNDGGCAEGDPICPITGRMFIDYFDFGFPGPLPLRWTRCYSSRDSDRETELGYGWSHPFAWRVRHRRRRTEVYDDRGRLQLFGLLESRGQVRKNSLNWTLEHTGDSLVLRAGDRDRRLTFGERDAEGWRELVSVSDRNGNRIQLQRDAAGVLVGMVDSAGRAYRVTNDGNGHITSIDVATNADASAWMRVVSYGFSQDGNLVSVTDAEGYQDRYSYSGHLVVSHLTPTDLTYYYRYDGRSADACCIESWGEYPGRRDPALDEGECPPFAKSTRAHVRGINWVRFTFDLPNSYTEVENSRGGVTRYFGDAAGRAVRIVDAEGNVTERVFDPETGVLKETSNESGAVQTSDPDGDGGATYQSVAGEPGVARWRTEDGTEVTYNEATLQVVQRRYDSRGNLVFTKHQDGTWEELAYDSRGLLTQQIHRNGGRTAFEHDTHGNCVKVSHPGGRVEENEYDFLGRRVRYSNDAGQETTWKWDRRNEIVYKRVNDGTEYVVQYDGIRRPVRLTVGGRTTHYEYGGVGWLHKITHPGGEVFLLWYDTEGGLTRVQNPRGQFFTQRRDLVGNVIEWTTFEGVNYSQAHTPKGEIAWIRSPVVVTTVETTDAGVPIALEAGDDKVEFEYSPLGLTRMDNGVALVERELDAFQRVLRERQGDHELALAWHNGQLSGISCDTALPVRFDRGPEGDVVAVLVGQCRTEIRNPVGADWIEFLGDRLLRRSNSSIGGVLLRQSLAQGNKHQDLASVGGPNDASALWWARYEWDGHRNLIAEHHSDGKRIDYELTPSHNVAVKRVSNAGQVLYEERYRYDAAGSPVVAGATYDALMRPTGYHGEKFEYDAVGRLIARTTDAGEWRYEWNALDQLVLVSTPKARIEMDYDARGRRLRKRVIVNGVLTKQRSYVWANHVVLHEVDDLSGATRTYIWDDASWDRIGHVDVSDGQEKAYFYVLKPGGGISHVVDADGAVVWAAEMTVLGHCEPTVEDIEVSVRYTNQHYDPDVELTYNRYRWYDARIGMYVTTDPAFLDGNVNPRDYVPNPYKFRDPLGLVAGGAGPPATTPSGGPAPVIQNNAAGGPYLAAPGHWATDGTAATPGYASCPTGAIDRGSGFGGTSNPNSAQSIVDRAGDAYGCHSCGTKDSGYGSYKDSSGKTVQHWTCDHQPPRSTYNSKTAAAGGAVGGASNAMAHSGGPGNQPGTTAAVRLYPHCKNCSRSQGQAMSAMASSGQRQQMAQLGLTQMAANQGIPI